MRLGFGREEALGVDFADGVAESCGDECVGAEVAARIMESAFDYLDAPVARVSGKDVPMPYAANLEKLALPSVAEVVEAARAVTYR